MIRPGGIFYKGNFKSGKRDGRGTIKFKEGVYCKGFWHNNEKKGCFEYHFKNQGVVFCCYSDESESINLAFFDEIGGVVYLLREKNGDLNVSFTPFKDMLKCIQYYDNERYDIITSGKYSQCYYNERYNDVISEKFNQFYDNERYSSAITTEEHINNIYNDVDDVEFYDVDNIFYDDSYSYINKDIFFNLAMILSEQIIFKVNQGLIKYLVHLSCKMGSRKAITFQGPIIIHRKSWENNEGDEDRRWKNEGRETPMFDNWRFWS